VLRLLQFAVRQASQQLLRLRRGRTEPLFLLSKGPADFGHVARLTIVGIDDLLEVLLSFEALICPGNLCVSQGLASDLDCTFLDRDQRCVGHYQRGLWQRHDGDHERLLALPSPLSHHDACRVHIHLGGMTDRCDARKFATASIELCCRSNDAGSGVSPVARHLGLDHKKILLVMTELTYELTG